MMLRNNDGDEGLVKLLSSSCSLVKGGFNGVCIIMPSFLREGLLFPRSSSVTALIYKPKKKVFALYTSYQKEIYLSIGLCCKPARNVFLSLSDPSIVPTMAMPRTPPI
jgi:hypothetical protein